MDEKEKQIRQRLKNDFVHYAEKCLKIRTKSGKILPFILNQGQKHIHEKIETQKRTTGRVRAIICKGRQLGSSTYASGRIYHNITHNYGVRAFILTHEADATDNLFEMAQRFYEKTPAIIKPHLGAESAKELYFDKLESGYKIGTAGNKATGRSSTIQYLLGSEVAYWPNASEHAKGILQTVPNEPGTEIILESTSSGMGNYFHEQWQLAESGDSDYIPIFVPWFWQTEYRRELAEDFSISAEEEELIRNYGLDAHQLAWRRYKIMELSATGANGEKAFCSEYPCIVGSQRIGTSFGIIPIQELKAGDETNHGIIKRQWESGCKDTIRLTTKRGYSLECTPDHRIKLINDTFLEASNLLNRNIQLSIPMFSKQIPSIEWDIFPCLKANFKITHDFALFLGFFMGDGSFHHDTLSIAFNKKDKNSINIVKDLFVKLFGREAGERTTSYSGYEIRCAIHDLRPLFEKLGAVSITNHATKRIVCVPDIIWRSPKDIIKRFLQGLFDADGFASKETARVKLFSKHEQFAKDVQLLLLGFGITCTRKKAIKYASNGKDYIGYELQLRASEARLFVQEIGFVSQDKVTRTQFWLLPKKIGRNSIPIVYQDEVNEIESIGKNTVYDLEMNNNEHEFDAQGILVHNCNSTESFQTSGEDTLIPPHLVVRARKANCQPIGSLVIGVDPARFGDDRTSIIYRRGRVAYNLRSYSKKDTMEVAGLVHKIIREDNPDKVFIDVGGLGAGVVDRLNELGVGDYICAVNAGSSPLDAELYVNKRAEMWGTLKKWLGDGPVQIPDSDSLHADLCGVRYKFDSLTRLVIERKEDMKKRGLRSPDESDALCFVKNTLIQTPYGKIPIQLLKIGDEVVTPFGNTRIAKTWQTQTDRITTATFSNNSILQGKGEHKIFVWGNGVCKLDALALTFNKVEEYSRWKMIKWKFLSLFITKERNSEFKPLVDIINQKIGSVSVHAFFIELFGQSILEKFPKVMSFITKIINGGITTFQTLKLCHPVSIQANICKNTSQIQIMSEKTKNIYKEHRIKPSTGINPLMVLNGIKSMERNHGLIGKSNQCNVLFAKKYLKPSLKIEKALDSAQGSVIQKDVTPGIKQKIKYAFGVIKNFLVTNIGILNVVPVNVQTESVDMSSVYNLTLEKHNVYYANDILVYNCLTFAEPVDYIQSSKNKSESTANAMMYQTNKLHRLRKN